MREKKTFSIPYPLAETLDKNVEINKTTTVIRAVNAAYKNKRQFVRFAEENINHPWIQKRVVLLSVYINRDIYSQLKILRKEIQRRLKIELSESRTLALALLFRFSQ